VDFGLLNRADDLDGYRDGEYGPSDYGYDLQAAYAAFGDGYGVCSYKERARLVAWLNGDWG
jgi:hypothetical protein